jgi:hypothetical protein
VTILSESNVLQQEAENKLKYEIMNLFINLSQHNNIRFTVGL